MLDVVILTDHRYIKPKKIDWYTKQILLEDQLLHDALTKQGLKVDRKAWSDKNFNWSETKYAIFRTTWDYFDRFNEFFKWLEETKLKTKFINSLDIIKWNIDKNYLGELINKGINVAPTVFLNKGEKVTLSQLFSNKGWEKAIIKPAISGASRLTYKINNKNYINKEKKFRSILDEESMLFQEFQDSILTKGEVSLILIGGEYTHAVIKKARKGDFRVQDDFGGTVKKHYANKKEIELAKRCLNVIPYKTIYARIDIIYDNKNKPSISELELIEPELWFRNYPKAAEKLAKEILFRFF